MASGNQNESLLSSWKEIAAYLKCGVRSCIRWEKNNGLPVYRSGDPQHSRVYAYREELDAWLKARLSAPEIPVKPAFRLRIWGKVALLTLVIGVAAFSLFWALKPQKGPKPFRLSGFNLVTAEPDGQGRLRVWGNRNPQSYVNIWDIATSPKNTVKHSSVAIGDIDGDGKSELVAPAYAKVGITRGEKESVYFKIFLNLYKQGQKGLWKTTFYNDGDCAWEDRIFWANQVILANLDEDPANEIILRTASGRIIYFPTLSASIFVSVRTRLWTLKPVWGQEINRYSHSGLRISRPTRNDSTSRAKISANRASSIRGISWKTPAGSSPPSVARKWICG